MTKLSEAVERELREGIANLREQLAGEEDRFWSRYLQGYLKAYESLLKKLPELSAINTIGKE
jgi:hypothetical protein